MQLNISKRKKITEKTHVSTSKTFLNNSGRKKKHNKIRRYLEIQNKVVKKRKTFLCKLEV